MRAWYREQREKEEKERKSKANFVTEWSSAFPYLRCAIQPERASMRPRDRDSLMCGTG